VKLQETVAVSAPIEDVFDGWAALERSPEHQKPTIERTKLTEGPVGPGTRYHAVDQWPGRKVSFEMEITDYQRPHRLAAAWEDPMRGDWIATFSPAGDGTTMTFETTIVPNGLMGLLEPMMRPWARKTLAAGLDTFRSWMESGKY
jgi:uncharacterized protein YndB with AHSA1/START domain